MVTERDLGEASHGLEEFLDSLTDEEFRVHPDVTSTVDKLGNIWSGLCLSQKTLDLELAQMLQIPVEKIGKLATEDEFIEPEVETRINRLFAIASRLERGLPDPEIRSLFLKTGNTLIVGKTPMGQLKRGNINEVLTLTAVSFT